MAKLRILVLCFPYFSDNSNTSNFSDGCSSLGCSKVSILLTLFNVISRFRNGNEMNVFVMFVYALKATYEALYFLFARLIELWSFVICKNNNREIDDVLVHQQVQYIFHPCYKIIVYVLNLFLWGEL
jgi:hypothetical protein